MIKKYRNMTQEKIIVEASASSANLGPGYDVFGLALDKPRDKIEITRNEKNQIELNILGKYKNNIPKDIKSNIVGIVAKKISEDLGITGINIKLTKNIPLNIGLGGSAASAAATVIAINELFQLKLSKTEVVDYATYGELKIAGSGHADNTSASIFGGFTIVKSYDPLEIINIRPPDNLEICIVIPDIYINKRKTEYARSVIPKEVNIDKVTKNIGNATALVYGMSEKNIRIIGESMFDNIVEPARAFLIPGYKKVKEMAIKSGAVGVAISGAGPSIIALLDKTKTDADNIGKQMVAAFKTEGIKSEYYVTRVGDGPLITKTK